ncbi:hypothetical protein ACFLZY_01595 [Patescibacteria group bacterium]
MDQNQNQGGNNQQEEQKTESQSKEMKPIQLDGDSKPQPKLPTAIIVAVIIVLAALIIGRGLNTPETEGNNHSDDSTPTVVSEDKSMDDNSKADEDKSEDNDPQDDQKTTDSNSNLKASYLTPEEFEGTKQAEKIINSTQGKTESGVNSEKIVAGIVEDESDSETVYFATSTANRDENFVGIYKYNKENFRWQRLYKNTYEPEKGVETRMLRVLGKEQKDLILMVDLLERKSEKCESLWLLATEEPYELVKMNLDDPYSGFEQYKLPSDLKTQEEKTVAACK